MQVTLPIAHEAPILMINTGRLDGNGDSHDEDSNWTRRTLDPAGFRYSWNDTRHHHSTSNRYHHYMGMWNRTDSITHGVRLH